MIYRGSELWSVMAVDQGGNWEDLRSRVMAPCPGCPRNQSKMPLIFHRRGPSPLVDFIVLSQEPGYWLRDQTTSDVAEQKLHRLCMERSSSDDLRRANPLTKVVQIFGCFDPSGGRIYWTHALKCVPERSDRDINKEWRKAATRCEEHFLDELRSLGKGELNILAFGKYALEMCLHLFEGQGIDQDLSISEFMQSSKLPVTYRYKFKDGTAKVINLYVFTNPSSEVVKIMKSGGKLTVEEIQELEIKRIREMLEKKK
jgi:hypothetical protein